MIVNRQGLKRLAVALKGLLHKQEVGNGKIFLNNYAYIKWLTGGEIYLQLAKSSKNDRGVLNVDT